MKYHFKPGELLERKEPAQIGLEYTSVRRLELGEKIRLQSGNEELCVVVIRGSVSWKHGSDKSKAGFMDMLYLPRGTTIDLEPMEERSVAMVYGAPAHKDTRFAHLRFEEIDGDPDSHREYGDPAQNCRRDVWHVINDDFDACRLMMGFCRGDPGGWTSWPPHEHTAEREEVYTYFDMGAAFGIQCVYEDMADPVTMALVRDGDIVSIPGGYHPNAGSPAGAICFVYCMTAKKPGDRQFMDLRIQKPYGNTFK